MNEIKIFTNEEFGSVRTVELNGVAYLVGKDVATILGYSNPRDALAKHVDAEDKGVTKCDTLGGVQELTVINESGLYSLILSSKLPSAKRFKHWVTSEVLPSIHKHGAYMTDQVLQKTLEDPDYMISLLQNLKQEREEKKRLAAENAAQHEQIALMEPKADYFDDLVERNLLTNFRDTAKEFGMGQKQFIRWLMEHDYIYRDAHGKLMPYAAKNKGYFEVKEYRSEYNQNAGTQTLITPKGRETFRLLVNRGAETC